MSEPEAAAEAPESTQRPAGSITFTPPPERAAEAAAEPEPAPAAAELPVEMEKIDKNEVDARQNGWVSKEEWVEQGNNAEDWMSAKNFLEKGDLIRRIRRSQDKEREFDQRLADNNAFWRAKLEQDKAELEAKRDEQIDMANKPAVKELDKQIQQVDGQLAHLEATATPQVTTADAEYETQWFDRNKDDLTTNKAKLLLTQSTFDQCKAKGLAGKELCDEIDRALQASFPPTNPNRQAAPVTDNKSTRTKVDRDEIHNKDNLNRSSKSMLNAMRRTSPRFAKMTDGELLKVMKDTEL